MNAITAISAAVLTMSSREIAELTGRDHGNVMRDIRTLLDDLQASDLKPVCETTTYAGANGQRYPQYELDRDTCLTLLLGYDAVARMKVVKRWQELEAQAAPAVPRTMSQALRLAAEQAEQIEQQQAALALAAPKAEYVDRYVAANGAKGFRQVAKLLGANEHAFRAWLQDEKIMYRLGGEWTAHQCHIDAGRFVVKTGVAQANEHAFNTTKFTPKGVNWVAGLWGQHQARLAQGERA
ncbi:antirepressor [Delftia sp. 670]|jgi:phage antirepressor YoqD-like protein|uniref:phage antirepressor KilAC domain-containing protein n=1 Tax=Delftia TaxID=80865 RepID=UPI0004D450A5|nr:MULTISPECIES: phage antirepressor KilAC domain-containing protein [Delftia]KAA9174661.1 phage regulatory protein/antirepressor Ant [Delftia sp. BR1]KEH13806.1 antirepressor [Delftia sp. 670]WQM84875.1 phage antirepressor KilAC domain-containing protein [Delftia tsuruhatensis]